jgi:hypothetical protein
LASQMFRRVVDIAAGALLLILPTAQAQAEPPVRPRGHVVLLTNLLGAPGTFGFYLISKSPSGKKLSLWSRL